MALVTCAGREGTQHHQPQLGSGPGKSWFPPFSLEKCLAVSREPLVVVQQRGGRVPGSSAFIVLAPALVWMLVGPQCCVLSHDGAWKTGGR